MAADPHDCPPVQNTDDEFAVAADPKLVAQGWVRRYVAGPDRAAEAVELYTALGFEVRVQELSPADFGPLCGDCPDEVCRSYVMIYTRGPFLK